MFVKHGFQNIAERARLGRFILRTPVSAEIEEKYTAPERLRMAFEELGPAFVKFGQLLATRADLIPQDYIDEFKKLHDQVIQVPFSEIEKVLNDHFGKSISEVFLEFQEAPIAAASIAQVHRARLKDGTDVVVKVQRPGIVKIIQEDLGVLYTIATLLEKYVPESHSINPVAFVDEFFKTLQLETNFLVEANNIRRFERNFANDPNIKIPHVYLDHSGRTVLVLEALLGVPLSNPAAVKQEGVDPETVVSIGLKAYFKMVYQDGLFHGDLHAGNLFILPHNKIGLIDFGVVGRLSRRVRDHVVGMFLALAQEDYEQLAWEYLELAPHSEFVDADAFARNLRDLISPYYGLTLKHMNVGKLLLDSSAVAAKHKLILPPELMLFFKSIVTVEGMGRVLVQDFDLLTYALDFATEIAKTQLDPARIGKDLFRFSKESLSLVGTLPRQIRTIMRRLTNPDYSRRISVDQLTDLQRIIEVGSNLVFLGLVIGALILAGTAGMFLQNSATVMGLPALSFTGFTLAFLLGLVAFYNYIRK